MEATRLQNGIESASSSSRQSEGSLAGTRLACRRGRTPFYWTLERRRTVLGIATKPRSNRAALTLTLVAALCALGVPAASSE
jgi:hypothetical protein